MRYEPPAHLVKILEDLGLCNLRGMCAVRPRVRRLARDLPAFDQVWIDALVQARRITPFQATLLAEENAARLKVGPFVLVDRLGRSDLGETYVARRPPRGRRVALKVLDPALVPGDSAAARLEPVLKKLAALKTRHLATPSHWALADDGRFYIASPWVCGPNATDVLIHFGRMPAPAVAEIARQLIAALASLWAHDLVHGDLRPSHLRLARNGKVTLTDPCVRLALPEAALLGVRRLPPERYDYLSPESFESGQASTPAADQFALGCLLWHLLAGRPPFPGADADAKRVARQRRDVPDVREHAPPTPAALASLIAALTCRDPEQRPQDCDALLRSLGRPGAAGGRQLARYGKTLGRRWSHRGRSRGRWLVGGASGAAAAAAVAVAVCIDWEPSWRNTLARFSRWRQRAPAVAEAVAAGPKPAGLGRGPTGRPIATVGGAIGGEEVLVLREQVYRVEGGYLKPPGQPGQRLALQPGMRIVGSREPAPMLVLEDGPLHLSEPDVQWENVRFVLARTAGETDGDPAPLAVVTAPGCRFRRCTFEVQDAPRWPTALVAVEGVNADFDGCKFEGPGGSARTPGTELPAAVDWQPTREPSMAPTPPQARPPGVELIDCTLEGFSAGVVVTADDLPQVALRGTTFRGPGVLVHLVVHDTSRGRVAIQLADCTTYNARAVIAVAYGRAPGAWPGCSLSAENCEFHFERTPSETGPPGTLVSFRGTEPTEALLRKVQWSGTGSAVISPDPIPAAAWDRGDQTLELPRRLVEQLPIDGITWGRLPPRRAEDTQP